MSDNAQGASPTYRIGTVSRLTGVPADTLRVWERRYSVVTPYRADSGTRLYGTQDVARLTLIKRLVDRGDAISSVANLSLAQLRERLSGADLPDPEPGLARPCRVAVLGAALSERLRRIDPCLDGVELVGLHDQAETFMVQVARQAPDLVLFEYPTLHSGQLREITTLFAQSGAAHAIVVYSFATREILERLDARRILAKRAPADPAELRRWCLAQHQSKRLTYTDSDAAGTDISRSIPPRRFTDRQLVRIATASTKVSCECPHHLVDLIMTLAAFESYCDECESQNAEDAALHGFLQASTAHARALMEAGLAKVMEAEGICPT